MTFLQVLGYHAHDVDGNLIATLHVDSNGNFIIDNGDDSLCIASTPEEAEVVHGLLGKVLSEINASFSKPKNILTITTEED